MQTRILKADKRIETHGKGWMLNETRVQQNQVTAVYDLVLRGGVFTLFPPVSGILVVIPASGEVITTGTDRSNVKPEQCLLLPVEKAKAIELEGSDRTGVQNVLLFLFEISGSKERVDIQLPLLNSLIPVTIKAGGLLFFTAILQSRKEIEWAVDGNATTLLFVLNGAVELAGCLTEYRDGLLLRHTNPVTLEAEALAENSIVFLFKLNLST